MKSKKGAFANSATGYGKRHNNNSHKSTNKSLKSAESSTSNNSKKANNFKQDDDKPKIDDDNDLNSGFGNYLRSNEGIEMMKIFVFANTMMVIVTMAWPHVQEKYIWLMEWWDSFKRPSSH